MIGILVDKRARHMMTVEQASLALSIPSLGLVELPQVAWWAILWHCGEAALRYCWA